MKLPRQRPVPQEPPKRVLTSAQQAFNESRKQESAALANLSDGNFFFGFQFTSRERRDAFLKAVGWWPYLEQESGLFLDGVMLARDLDVELTTLAPPPTRNRLDQKYMNLVGDMTQIENIIGDDLPLDLELENIPDEDDDPQGQEEN